MKKMTLFKVLVVFTLGVVALGFYRGWFVLSSQRDAGQNTVDINLTVDPDKAKADVRSVDASARGLVDKDADGQSDTTTQGGGKSTIK